MATLTPDRLLTLGTRTLALLGGLAVTATWLLAWLAPQYVILVPIAGILILLGMLVHDQPLVPLFVLLMVSVVNIGGAEGIELPELLYGIGVVIYLGVWYAHAFLTGKRFIRSRVDQAWALWLLWACIGGAILGPLFGAEPNSYSGELQLALFFFFYFPIKEEMRTKKRGILVVLVPALFMGVWISIANGIEMIQTFRSAKELWEIIDVREPTGNAQMTMTIILGLALASTVKQRWMLVLLIGIVIISVAGLIFAKSRMYWIACTIGISLAWLALPTAQDRKQLIWYIVVGCIATIVFLFILFPDIAILLTSGVSSRFATLGEAGTDISLLERFAESIAVGEKILANPVIGYGWGVPFVHYDIISQVTDKYSFVHNLYISLLYKHGVIGLSVMLAIWVLVILKSYLLAHQTKFHRGLSAGLFGLLAAYAFASITSNIFMVMDQVGTAIIAFGLVEGLSQYSEDISNTQLNPALQRL